MDELKSVDRKLLKELFKNSRRSDRELSRSIGMSQPTITRRRTNLEKSLLEGYTAIPKWEKIGFEIVAFTFVKHRIKFVKKEVREQVFNNVREWMKKQPCVLLAIDGLGMGYDAVFVSVHKNYSDFTEFINRHNSDLAEFLIDSQSFVANYNPTTVKKQFHLKYLAEMM
jgi:DNA-binding Lrp family transcriptional regulator